MPASLPVSPLGSVTSTTFSSCWPSPRVMRTRNGLYLPALVWSDFAEYPGANLRAAIVFGQLPSPGSFTRVTELLTGLFSPSRAQGSKWLVPVAVQIGGLVSTWFGPLKCTRIDS